MIFNEKGCSAPMAAAKNVSVCNGQSAKITATDGTIYNWYDSPDGDFLLATGAIYNTPPLTANTTVYVSNRISNISCESSRKAVTVFVKTVPQPIAFDVTACSGNTTILKARMIFSKLFWIKR